MKPLTGEDKGIKWLFSPEVKITNGVPVTQRKEFFPLTTKYNKQYIGVLYEQYQEFELKDVSTGQVVIPSFPPTEDYTLENTNNFYLDYPQFLLRAGNSGKVKTKNINFFCPFNSPDEDVLQTTPPNFSCGVEMINFETSNIIISEIKDSVKKTKNFYGYTSSNLNYPNQRLLQNFNNWKDGEVIWEVLPNYYFTVGFPVSYFTSSNSSGGIKNFLTSITSITIPENIKNNYKKSNENLVLEIEEIKQEDLESTVRRGGVYSGVVGFNENGGTGSGARFTVFIESSESLDENGNNSIESVIEAVTIFSGGVNYKEGDKIKIPGVSIGSEKLGEGDLIVTVKKVTKYQGFIFKSFASIAGVPVYPESRFITTSSFSFYGSVVDSNGSLTIIPYNETEFQILDEGYGFNNLTANSSIYFTQYNLNDKIVDENNLPATVPPIYIISSNLLSSYVVINLQNFVIRQSSYNYFSEAPVNLWSNASPPTISFNFMNNGSVFDKSPQQLIWLGETNPDGGTLLETIVKVTEGDIGKNFMKIFNFGKLNFQTGALGRSLKSLQITGYNYTTSSFQEKILSTSQLKLTLGRYIPYKSFTNVVYVDEDTRTPDNLKYDSIFYTRFLSNIFYGKGETFYNYNNFQFIPFKVKDIYTNVDAKNKVNKS